ncbi:hypothetical protein Syun_009171 [Stephania yunnanensis]|uniref:Uncharacterized protein n=1 Tax=Stephania yunnanensis TaxID=152371 RepID=A0AAP0PNT3_9MAGN
MLTVMEKMVAKQQPPQIDPVDPPQQGDNVERETQECLTRDEHLDVTFACLSMKKVPSAWRPVLEDPSNRQIFFDYYAIAKPPILKEIRSVSYFRNREIFFAVGEHLSVYPGEGSIKRREYTGHFAIAISFAMEWIYYEPYLYLCRVFPGSSIALSEWIKDWKLQSLLRVLLVSVANMIFWSGVALTLVNVIFGLVVSLYGLLLNCSEGAVGVNGSHGFKNLAGIDAGMSNGSETKLLYSISDPLLIRDGSETEYNNFVSDPFLIRDGSETKDNNSVSDPLLIRDGSETECNYNCTLLKNFHLCSVSVPFLNSVSNPYLISNGNTFPLLIQSATTILEME